MRSVATAGSSCGENEVDKDASNALHFPVKIATHLRRWPALDSSRKR
jgi:hypothetical protein